MPSGSSSRWKENGGKGLLVCRVHLTGFPVSGNPTTNGGTQNESFSWNICTLHTRFGTFGTNLCAQLVLTNKISASELSRKIIKSTLLVGYHGC